MNNLIWLTLGMSAVTYLGRIIGYCFICYYQQPSAKVEAFLKAVPGTIFMAMVAPQIANQSSVVWIGSALVFAIAAKTHNLLIALLVGGFSFAALQYALN